MPRTQGGDALKTPNQPTTKSPRARGANRVVYAICRAVSVASVGLYFRRIEVRHAERVPSHGPLLIVANHPSAMTDALVLATHLPRRIHVLAMSPLFKPWFRGALMRAVGALPVYRREDDPALTVHNETTFAACHAFLDEGGAVLLFPEGRSDTDRRVVQLKTGAARLAIAQEQRPTARARLTLLPVGLYFEDRTRFHSEVILSVGEPILLAPFVARAQSDSRAAVLSLTADIQRAIESLIQVIPEPAARDLVEELEALYLQEMKSRGDLRHDLDLRQRLSECVEYFGRTDPERVVAVSRQLTRYRRMLHALQLEDAALREFEQGGHWRRSHVARLAIACAGFPFAILGMALFRLPYEACAWLARRLSPHPALMSSIHILAGVLIFPLWLLALGVLGWKVAGWSLPGVGLGLGLAIGLGVFAAAYSGWWERQPGFVQLPLLAMRREHALVRVRLERKELFRVFDQARADFLAATGGRAGGRSAS